MGLSYYPYWHGSLDSMKKVVESMRSNWNEQVFVAETAWPFTLEDGDDWGNVIWSVPETWPASPEGQAFEFCNVCRAAAEAGAMGVFYWGGIWTPVGTNAGENWPIWEQCGSGWASSYAAAYDPDNVGEDYGGCAWDNQALFDFDGRPLYALDAIHQLSEGSFPEGIAAQAEEAPVVSEVENLVLNPGFEEEDCSMWAARSAVADIPFDYQNYVADAHGGSIAFHYWSEQDMDFTIEQTLTGLEPGTYEASAWSQGGDMKDAELTFYVISDGARYEQPFMNTSWADWQNPVISDIPVTGGELTVGAHIKCAALGWGTLDDFCVCRQ